MSKTRKHNYVNNSVIELDNYEWCTKPYIPEGYNLKVEMFISRPSFNTFYFIH